MVTKQVTFIPTVAAAYQAHTEFNDTLLIFIKDFVAKARSAVRDQT